MVLKEDLVTITSVAEISEIKTCLETSHSAFPVMNLAGNLCGVMPRKVICQLLEKSHFYN